MATTTEQQQQMQQTLLEVPLLPGDSRDEDDVVVVCVAINPSVLDRFLRSEDYYFYDDISVPYQSLLVGAEHELLPSQRERLLLLAEDGGGGSSSTEGNNNRLVFGHLWMRLCARLSKARAESIRNTRDRFAVGGLLWMVSYFLLGLRIIESTEGDSCLWLLIVPMVFGLYSIAVRFEMMAEAEAQSIVDDTKRSFSDEGFHVDLVTSHPVMHIRIQRAPAPTTTTTMSSSGKSFASSSRLLREAMEGFQLEAFRNHQDALISARHERLKTSRPPDTILGIRFTTLLWWQPCLKTIVAIFGFLWAGSLVMGVGNLMIYSVTSTVMGVSNVIMCSAKTSTTY